MDRARSQVTLVATSLLGVMATAIFIAGVFVLFGAWVIWRDAGPSADEVGTVATLLIALLMFGLAIVAAVAARDEWLGRQRGRMLGLVVSLVVGLAAVSAMVLGRLDNAEPLLDLAVGLALVTALPLLATDETNTFHA